MRRISNPVLLFMLSSMVALLAGCESGGSEIRRTTVYSMDKALFRNPDVIQSGSRFTVTDHTRIGVSHDANGGFQILVGPKPGEAVAAATLNSISDEMSLGRGYAFIIGWYPVIWGGHSSVVAGAVGMPLPDFDADDDNTMIILDRDGLTDIYYVLRIHPDQANPVSVRIENSHGVQVVTTQMVKVEVSSGSAPSAPVPIGFDPFQTTPPPPVHVATWKFLHAIVMDAKSLGLWF